MCVGAAAPQRRDPPERAEALKARDHRHLVAVQALVQLPGLDPLDPGTAVAAVGADRDLPAEPGARGDAAALQRERQQAGRDLLARRGHGVVFPRIVQRCCGPHPGDQPIGGAGHGRDHDRDPVAGIGCRLHAIGDHVDAVEVGQRRAAVFVNDQSHRVQRACVGEATLAGRGDAPTYWLGCGRASE